MMLGPPPFDRTGLQKKAVGGPWLELQKGLSGDPPPHTHNVCREPVAGSPKGLRPTMGLFAQTPALTNKTHAKLR